MSPEMWDSFQRPPGIDRVTFHQVAKRCRGVRFVGERLFIPKEEWERVWREGS